MPTRGAGLEERVLTHSVIGAFFEVYNILGYGFLERVYSLALDRELIDRGHKVEREVAVPIYYKGEFLARQRVDRIVDKRLVVELKATAILPAHAQRQLLSYLRATHLEVGLLLHFGPDAKFYRVVALNSSKESLAVDPYDPSHPFNP